MMPRSKTGNKRDPVDAEALQNAIEAIKSNDPDKKMTFREAEKVFKVSRSTLTRHLKKFNESGANKFEYNVSYAVKQVFTSHEEQSLVTYIQNVAKMQYGLTKKGVRILAYKFARANKKQHPETWNNDEMAGEEWMRAFLKRHSDQISIRKPEATSLSRATSFNRHNVHCFFDNLKDVHNRFGPIPPEKIWNTDETGLSTVQGQSRIVAPKGIKQIGSATSAERGQLVTMIAAVSAIGNTIPPLLIFPRVHFKDRMIAGGPPGCIGAATPTGWSNEETFLKFFDHFLSHVKCSKESRCLLILDNHDSHLSPEVLDKASDAGVVIVTFPPHTSHKLQPLDVSVYSPLKTYYNQAVQAWMINNGGKTFDIYTVAEALGTAYPRAFTPNNIISGFRKTGIFPFNEAVFSDDDFMASYVTDRVPAPSPASERPASEKAVDPVATPSTDNQTPSNTSNVPTVGASATSFMPVAGPSSDTNHSIPLRDLIRPTLNSSDEADDPDDPGLPSTPSGSTCVGAFVTPEEVQPYPKAGQRKKKKSGGKKTGKTLIATDTPEKNIIKEEKEKSRAKKRAAEERLKNRSKITKKLTLVKTETDKSKDSKVKTLKIKKTKMSKEEVAKKTKIEKCNQSSSDTEDDGVLSLVSTDDEDSEEEVCVYCCNPIASDKSGEKWCRCISCGKWTHYLCAGVEGSEWKKYMCDFCSL